MVRSRSSCSKTNRSFSSITLLVFHGMRLFYTQLPKFCSVRDAPGLICQGCARSVPLARVREVLMAGSMQAHCAQIERLGGAGFARRSRRTGWGANFMSYDSTKWRCCQEKYILGELLVRTDWQVIVGARVTEDR